MSQQNNGLPTSVPARDWVEVLARYREPNQQVLADRKRRDVADPSPGEISRRRVVNGVAASPNVIGRQCQDTKHTTDPIIDRPPAEERSMPAVVLNCEEAHEKAGSRYRYGQGEPDADRQSCPSQRPEDNKGCCRDDEL